MRLIKRIGRDILYIVGEERRHARVVSLVTDRIKEELLLVKEFRTAISSTSLRQNKNLIR
jgi:hypothetical protein